MQRVTIGVAFAGAVIGLTTSGSAVLSKQDSGAEPAAVAARSAPPKRALSVHVTSVNSYMLTVANLDRSFAFYRDVVGLPVLRGPSKAAANPMVERLTDTPGAQFRSAAFRIPGASVRLLLTEFTHVERRAQQPHNVDPGAATLAVTVRDLDPVLAAAERRQARVVTRGGRPLQGRSGTQAIVLRDPDGFYVDFSQQGTADSGAAAGTADNVVSAHMVYTVAEPGPVVRFYRDLLGLTVTPNSFAMNKPLDDLVDAPGASVDSIQATAKGTTGSLEFVAFKGVGRHIYLYRPQDPGAAAIALSVQDLGAALRGLRTSGALIVSAGGQAVNTGHGGQSLFIRDPAGVLLEVMQQR